MKCISIINLIAVFANAAFVESVIMEPRLYHPHPDIIKNVARPLTDDIDVPSPLLSILEVTSISTKTNSKSSITINLNRAIDADIDIEVSVYSSPNLITFNNAKQTSHNKLIVHYPAHNFGDANIEFNTNDLAGHAEIVCKVLKQPHNVTIDDSNSFISVDICKSYALDVIIQTVGWMYFFAWSISFYFQVVLNHGRKSVVGLNFDFLALNLLGFTCYTIYNFTLMFSRNVQNEYYQRHAYSRIPVEYNDLFFAGHAFLITFVTIVQCFIYEVSTVMQTTRWSVTS